MSEAVLVNEESGLSHVCTVLDRDGDPVVAAKGSAFRHPLFIRDMTPKEWVRFVKSTESQIRNSPEYKAWVAKMKTDHGMTGCSVMPGVTGEDASIELHHCPLTLYDTVEIVASHIQTHGFGVTTMGVAHEVLRAHMRDLICCAALSTTLHQAVHAGDVNLKPSMVVGDLMTFLSTYRQGVGPAHMDHIMAFMIAGKGALAREGTLELAELPNHLSALGPEEMELAVAGLLTDARDRRATTEDVESRR